MTALFIAATILSLINVGAEFARDVMMMQQNSYRIDRYRRWLSQSGDTTSIMRLISLVIVFVAASIFSIDIVWMSLVAVDSLVNSVILLRRKYKKPLVYTPRVKRILAMMWLLALAVLCLSFAFGEDWWMVIPAIALAEYVASHNFAIAAVWVLKPVEKAINNRYYRDAQRILQSMPDLKVIGITGSYGKTSTKHYLYRILQEKYDTVMTPGSFNTTLGVVRTIREYMKPYNQVFICEMGAKQPGDIKEICDLVHPSIGIITAVGEQHLESFKSIENVQRTKFELIDSLPADGFAVVNNDFEWAARREVKNVDVARYAVSSTEDAKFVAEDIRYTPSGTEFTLKCPDGSKIIFKTRLVGACNVSNLMAAIIVAMHLGVETEKIKYAVEHIEQVEHRLNMKRTPGGITIIDDAFNSNPTGSAMALDVLASMTGGKRIVVTPGMIELGDRQGELNREFGKKISTSADVAIIVGRYNREAITEGIAEAGNSEVKVLEVDTFDDARRELATLMTSGDTVLYENDLPDTFK
ncbi:MAG: UDP-N-acetylmuramoyl-tripeptide--D-alanyl-D-alanine ligase [Duncaniella sp.]|nr:UDP-N-acetylmuramoyl-tripeptide--D-alanyl-D-alanine ligase [Duncaniella sp.]